MHIILFFLIALTLSALATRIMMPWLMRLCHKKNLYDQPNERKVHHSRIPRLGGVVFAPTAALGVITGLLLLTSETDIYDSIKVSTLVIGLGMLITYIIGLLDDVFGLSAQLKFGIQFIAALCFPLSGIYCDNLYGLFGIYEINIWAGQALTILIVMFVSNAINTIDGIDGLCAGLSCIALVVYSYFFFSIHNYIYVLFTYALLGSLIVFLYYNIFGKEKKGTKTFMGDSGSLMLGFSLSYLGVKLSMSNVNIAPPEQGLLIPISVLLIPTFDLIRVATNRILRGVHPFCPDKTHVHHLLMGVGLSQRQALVCLLALDIAIIGLNFTLWYVNLNLTYIVLIDVIVFSLFIRMIRKSEQRQNKR